VKVYLAARYQEHPAMRVLRDELVAAGIVVTSRWIEGGHDIQADADHDEQRQRFCMEDLEDVDACDVLVVQSPKAHHRTGRGGRHVEVGYALAKGKPVILVGERENVFHWHPLVRLVDDNHEVATAIKILGDLMGLTSA